MVVSASISSLPSAVLIVQSRSITVASGDRRQDAIPAFRIGPQAIIEQDRLAAPQGGGTAWPARWRRVED